jgi:hypothetical protein
MLFGYNRTYLRHGAFSVAICSRMPRRRQPDCDFSLAAQQRASFIEGHVVMPNSIHNLDTRWFENESGKYPAIVMGLNITDMKTAESFLDQVILQFKSQRMCSPPKTANFAITIAGDMTADEFRAIWVERSLSDPVLKHFMSIMVLADVLHILGRELLDCASMVSQAGECV